MGLKYAILNHRSGNEIEVHMRWKNMESCEKYLQDLK